MTLENGKLKRVKMGYDEFNNVTSVKEYDLGAGGQGALLRETTHDYADSINGYC